MVTTKIAPDYTVPSRGYTQSNGRRSKSWSNQQNTADSAGSTVNNYSKNGLSPEGYYKGHQSAGSTTFTTSGYTGTRFAVVQARTRSCSNLPPDGGSYRTGNGFGMK